MPGDGVTVAPFGQILETVVEAIVFSIECLAELSLSGSISRACSLSYLVLP